MRFRRGKVRLDNLPQCIVHVMIIHGLPIQAQEDINFRIISWSDGKSPKAEIESPADEGIAEYKAGERMAILRMPGMTLPCPGCPYGLG